MSRKASKLTEANVKRIRKLTIDGVPIADTAERFNIHASYARLVAVGDRWTHVKGPRAKKMRKARTKPGTYKARSKKATKASSNGRMPDMTTLPVDEVLRILQALSNEWPKVRASFMLLDAIMGGRDDGS